MGKLTSRRRVLQITESAGAEGERVESERHASDTLSVEEPLEIRLAGEAVVVTMRTPGHDVELAHGWLHSEGYITGREHVRTARFCEGDIAPRDDDAAFTGAAASYNIIDITLDADRGRLIALDPDLGRRHGFTANSSCGICGSQTIDQLMREARFDPAHDRHELDAERLWSSARALSDHQPLFAKTGSIHGAALFAPDGNLLVAREDVGRHNAVDKVLGWALLNGTLDARRPLAGHLLMVSSRASFEIVQKAHLAGVPIVATVSGATSLAVDAAEHAGITLAGFVRADDHRPDMRKGRATIYTHPHRIRLARRNTPSGVLVEES